MSEVRKYSWPLSLSRWKCKCLVKKKKWAENICYSYLLLNMGIWGFLIYVFPFLYMFYTFFIFL